MTSIVGIFAWLCWPLRHQMKWVRRGIVAVIVGLHFIMNAPVWFIFDRISGYIGGDGWHRSNLIDKFVQYFTDWCFVGMPMEKTINWAATVTESGYVDVTNYYISVGINGGLVSLIIYIIMLTTCFKLVGLGLNSIRVNVPKENGFEPLLWGLGSTVLAHVVNISAVQYYDQSYVIWYLHMAIAVTLSNYFLQMNADSWKADTKYINVT